MHGIDQWAAQAQDFETLCPELATTDVLVVLGGDGTLLRAARAVIQVDVPLLGINLGKIGFLSKVEANELEAVLAKLVGGRVHDRRADGARGPDPARRPRAGGRRSITRSTTSSSPAARSPASSGSTWRSGRATSRRSSPTASSSSSPTGSTGYSFSAGGPIVDPTSRNLIVTPIAGYLSAIRSVVVGPDQIVRCRVVDATEAIVSIDGREDLPIAVGDVVEVRALERPVRLVEPAGSQPFWDLFRRKVELLPS